MAVTRRVFVSGAMAAPLLAQMGGTAAASPDAADQVGDLTFTYLDGIGELRLTDFALRQLATQQIGLQAVAPATPITGADGKTVEGIKLAPEYGTGTVTATGQPSKGRGRVLGGAVLQSSKARMEVAGIRSSLPDGRIFAFLKVNDQWLGELPLYMVDPSAARLAVQPGLPGQPATVKSSGIPVTPTQEGVDAFTKAFGVALFTTKDTVLTASGAGHMWPLPALPVA